VRRTSVRIVVAVMSISFLLTLLSGLVVYAPGTFLPVFGISFAVWRTIHLWSAVALTVTLAAHLTANGNRLTQLFRSSAAPAPEPATQDPAPESQSVVAVPHHHLLSRRRFLILLGAGAATVLGVVGLDRFGPPPRQGSKDPLSGFAVLNVEVGAPAVAAADWTVVVDGLVSEPLHLDRSAWLALPRVEETRNFLCVEGWSVSRLRWEGVRVAELLRLAGPTDAARFVSFHTFSGTYLDTLTLDEAQAQDVLLADTLDGAPLSPDHGGPLRLVVPTQLGYKNVKWVVRVELTAERARGYWEERGYPAEAPI
jgi:hypothetical protein